MKKSRSISVRVMKYGLIMEWTAKLCILLPFCLAGKPFGEVVMCFLLGGAVWGVVVTLIYTGMEQSRSGDGTAGLCRRADYVAGFGDLSRSAGRAAGFYGVTVLLFCAAQAAVFVRLGAELAAQYLLPRTAASERAVERLMLRNPSAGFGTQVLPSQALIVALCLVVFAVAAYFAVRRYRRDKIAEGKAFENSYESNHVRVRKNIWRERYGAGGLCVIAGAAVAGGMVLLAALCASGASSWTAGRTSVRNVDSILRGSFEVFACLGGVSLPVLYHYMETEKEQEEGLMSDNQEGAKRWEQALRAVRRAGRLSLVLSGFVCAAAIAFYGSGGAGSILFPAVSMMGVLPLVGILPQHVERVFALLLFVCAVAAAASALCLTLRLTARLYPAAAVLLAGLRTEPDLPGVSAPKSPGMQPSDLPGTLSPEIPGAMPSGFSRAVRRFQWAALSVVCIASAGFSSGITAVSYYRAWNMQLLVPLMLILYGWYCVARRCQRVRVTLNRQPERL